MDKNRTYVSITEANKNFSDVSKKAKIFDEVIVLKNNQPTLKIVDINNSTEIDMTDDEKIMFVAKRILKNYKKAFMELAKWLN